jgi:hypothetical protein
MGKALRRAGWALLTAGGLVAASPGMAQQTRHVSPCCSIRNCPSAASGESTGLSAEQARNEEVNVELGWLADPASFGCSLAARVQGGALTVRGFAPTEAVRRRVLAVAQAHTTLPIQDALQICADMAVRTPGVARPEDLQKGAALLLLEGFPGQAEHFQVQAGADGTVMVAGAVFSREDQLGVSRWLRRLPGCSCVLNQLDVVPDGVASAALAAAPDAPAVQPTSYEPPSHAQVETGRVTNGVILLSGVDRSPSPAARPVAVASPAPSREALKRRIEAVCGRAVRDVQVVPHATGSVQIRFTLRDRSKRDEVCSKILSMPELEAYHISFQMQTEP